MANLFKSLDTLGLGNFVKRTILSIRQFFATKNEMDVVATALTDLDKRKIEISDIPTSLPANGGNADTINGYSSSDFVLNTNYGEFKSVVATALTDLDTRKVDVSDLVDYEVIITEQGASGNTLKSYVIT